MLLDDASTLGGVEPLGDAAPLSVAAPVCVAAPVTETPPRDGEMTALDDADAAAVKDAAKLGVNIALALWLTDGAGVAEGTRHTRVRMTWLLLRGGRGQCKMLQMWRGPTIRRKGHGRTCLQSTPSRAVPRLLGQRQTQKVRAKGQSCPSR